jgi:hypothetical protein
MRMSQRIISSIVFGKRVHIKAVFENSYQPMFLKNFKSFLLKIIIIIIILCFDYRSYMHHTCACLRASFPLLFMESACTLKQHLETRTGLCF